MKNNAKITIELLEDGRLAVKFPYNNHFLAGVRALSDRKWNSEKRRWEIGIAHLQELLEILRVDMSVVNRKVFRAYQMYKIRNGRVRINADNLHATLYGVHLPLEKIDRLTSFHVPGYKFMTRFKDGAWDGKRHLFHKANMTFPSGLISRVETILHNAGMKCETHWPPHPEKQDLASLVVKIKKQKSRRTKTEVKLTTLRDYQAQCLDSALTARRGIIEIATGGGKTLIAAHIIHHLSRPTLFLVHTRDLLYQTVTVLGRELNMPIGCVGDGRVDIQPVTVATVQTCAKAFDIKVDLSADEESLDKETAPSVSEFQRIREMVQTASVVIFDECHHLPAETSYGLANEMVGAFWRYGLSATPYRADRQDLLMEAALGPKIFSARASALIELGYLVPPNIKFLRVPTMITKKQRTDYNEIYTAYVVQNRRRNRLVVEAAIQQVEAGKSVLILVTRVRHGEILRSLLDDAPLLQGNDSVEYRRGVFQALAKKHIHLAIATNLADEGLDIPSLDCVILAGAGKSETRALQRIGRALRRAPRKKHATVIDFFDDAPYLRDHSSNRLELYKTESHFVLDV